jgi:hypothetical protein
MMLICGRCEAEGRHAVLSDDDQADARRARVGARRDAYGLCIEHAFVALAELAAAHGQPRVA